MRVVSFPPLCSPHACVLILGSMPGEASLRAHEYYAHPRNAFWPIMGELFGFAPTLPYDERVRRVLTAGVAIWDVLASCHRPGSADADIEEASMIVNDFETFFTQFPRAKTLFLNGSMAENAFRKHVVPKLTGRDLTLHRLPSTSPAHASRTLPQKIEAWRIIPQLIAAR